MYMYNRHVSVRISRVIQVLSTISYMYSKIDSGVRMKVLM